MSRSQFNVIEWSCSSFVINKFIFQTKIQGFWQLEGRRKTQKYSKFFQIFSIAQFSLSLIPRTLLVLVVFIEQSIHFHVRHSKRPFRMQQRISSLPPRTRKLMKRTTCSVQDMPDLKRTSNRTDYDYAETQIYGEDKG